MNRFILLTLAAASLFAVGATFNSVNPAARPAQQVAEVSTLPAELMV